MTIAKIMQNHSFRATFQYAVAKSGARIIGGNVAPLLERDQLSNQQLKALIAVTVKQFMMSADLNLEIKRPVYHLSIALPPQENLDDADLSQFCEFFIAALILTAQQPTLFEKDPAIFRDQVEQFQTEELPKYQYSIVRHVDADHAHAHIIASKINLETEQALSTSYDYYRAQKILRDLERQYDLTVLDNSWEVGRKAETRRQIQTELETGMPSAQKQMQNALDRAIAASRTIPEFVEQALSEGVEVRVGFTRTGKPKGISYAIKGVAMAGNQLGNRYSFPGLQKNSGLSYEADRDDDLIRELCQQTPLTIENRLSTFSENKLTNALTTPSVEKIREAYNPDANQSISSSTLESELEQARTIKELEQWLDTLLQPARIDEAQPPSDLSQSEDTVLAIPISDSQAERASEIALIAIQLFEYYVQIGEPAYKEHVESEECLYRFEVSGFAYLVSRHDTTDAYNVRREDSKMNLQLQQGITAQDLRIWQELSEWLARQAIAPPSLAQRVKPKSTSPMLEYEDVVLPLLDKSDEHQLVLPRIEELPEPSWQSEIQQSEPERHPSSDEVAEFVQIPNSVSLEPQETEFARQARFAQAISAEIRWLGQIENFEGNHYRLLQVDDCIDLARKDGQVIGRFPLDAAELPQGFALSEIDVERFQLVQQHHWAVEIGETVLTSWQEAGEPGEIEGKQYDVHLVDDSLYLYRKGEVNAILEIPLDLDKLPKAQQLTQDDFDRFDQAKAALRQHERERDERDR